MIPLGDALNKARVDKNLTLRQASEYLGLSAMYISELETGRKVTDKEETLKKFANFYDLDYTELLLRAKLSQEKKTLVESVQEENLVVARALIFEDISSAKIQEIKKILERKS